MNLIKKYSADIGMTTNQIMSSDEPITDQVLESIKLKASRYKNYPIYYFDVSGTADDMRNTVVRCREKNPDKKIFCIVDHTTLVTPRNHETELELVTYLANMSIKIKKQTKCTFLFLGQLNSNIESYERLTNPSVHAPMRSDLFGGKAVFNAMDAIFMPHRPELLKIRKYTMDELDTRNKMFFHVTKQRFGRLGTIMMDTSRLGFNEVNELELFLDE
jgi:replicative DNA helicase